MFCSFLKRWWQRWNVPIEWFILLMLFSGRLVEKKARADRYWRYAGRISTVSFYWRPAALKVSRREWRNGQVLEYVFDNGRVWEFHTCYCEWSEKRTRDESIPALSKVIARCKDLIRKYRTKRQVIKKMGMSTYKNCATMDAERKLLPGVAQVVFFIGFSINWSTE